MAGIGEPPTQMDDLPMLRELAIAAWTHANGDDERRLLDYIAKINALMSGQP